MKKIESLIKELKKRINSLLFFFLTLLKRVYVFFFINFIKLNKINATTKAF